MRTVQIEQLSLEGFLPFGAYHNFIQPRGTKIGEAPTEFFRDSLLQSLVGPNVSFSTCRVRPRPPIIDVLEYHSHTMETMMALDGDMIVQVAPASRPDDPVPIDQVRGFHVPRGTMVLLHAGVWHHAPFALESSDLHILVALPPRTYANDCIVRDLSGDDRIALNLPTAAR